MFNPVLPLHGSPEAFPFCIPEGADLSGEEDGSVIMLWVPVTRGVEFLLPAAEVAQGEAAVVGHLRPRRRLLHHQHLHHHQADGVPQAGMLVDVSCHGHQGQDVVLWGKRWAGRAWVKPLLRSNCLVCKERISPINEGHHGQTMC